MTTTGRGGSSYLDRPAPSGLAEVVDLILDKGLVIDIYVRVALVGIELLTIDARIVIASVDTYLRFAEAVNRLDLTQNGPKGLPDLMGDLASGGAKSKTRGAVEGIAEKARDTFTGDHEDEDDYEDRNGDRGRRPRSGHRRG
jgi:gas vesicle structural protein